MTLSLRPARTTTPSADAPSRRRRATGLAGTLALAATAVAGGSATASAAPGPAAPAPAAPSAGTPAPPATTAEAQARLDEVTARLAESERRQGEAQARAEQLTREAEQTALRLDELRTRLGDRARAVYTGGLASEPLVALLTSDRPTAAVDRLSMLDAAQGHDNDVLDETLAAQRRLEEQRAAAEAAVREAAAAHDALQRDVAELGALLHRLVAEEEAARARAAEEARARAAVEAARSRAARAASRGTARTAAAVPAAAAAAAASGLAATGGQACPVGSVHSFVDSWGAARSGGRAHKGTDVMAPYGSPAYAVVDGVISRAGNNGLGGVVLYLTGANGHRYYYAHNSANLVSEGQRVVAGQEIAKVGNSGNAAGGAAHIHFEVHPGGGAAVNPYAFLRSVCG